MTVRRPELQGALRSHEHGRARARLQGSGRQGKQKAENRRPVAAGCDHFIEHAADEARARQAGGQGGPYTGSHVLGLDTCRDGLQPVHGPPQGGNALFF